MGSTRNGWMRRMGMSLAALALVAIPAANASIGVVTASPVGACGSTVYMSVTNTSLQPATATLNLSILSGQTTIVGSANVALAPLATAVVPVPMSGSVSKVSLSTSLKVAIIDTDGPFCN